jgi:hypothetical protein
VGKPTTVVGANLCVPHPLEVKGKGPEVGEVADKKEKTGHTVDIISLSYFVTCRLRSCVGNVFGLHSTCFSFPSTRKLMT